MIGAITGVPETSNDCLCSMAVVPEDGTILGEASSILFKKLKPKIHSLLQNPCMKRMNICVVCSVKVQLNAIIMFFMKSCHFASSIVKLSLLNLSLERA